MAVRRSLRATWISSAQRRRVSSSKGWSPDSASDTPKRCCTTPSCTSRARSIRCSRATARSCCRVAARAIAASAAILPRIHSTSRSVAVSGGPVAAAVAEDRAEPAPARRHRRADDGPRAEQRDVLGRELALEVLAALDHAILLERLGERAPRTRG